MKRIYTALIILASVIFLASCNNDNGNGSGGEVSENVKAAFSELFPDVSSVNWTSNSGYYVAKFTHPESNVGAEAWFESSASWQMTVTDISYQALPQSVKTTFETGIYSTWTIEDVDMLERTGLETIYVIEVEDGNQEYDLYYSAEGILIKAVADDYGTDNSSGYIPGEVTSGIQAYIAQNHPTARIVDIDRERNQTEVDIIENGIHLELTFSSDEVWQMTISEINYRDLPQAVSSAHEAGQYGTWRVEEVDMVDRNGMERIYVLEAERGDLEVELYYSSDGTLVKELTDNDDDDNSSGYYPEELNAAIQSYIDTNHSGARIVETDRDGNYIEVDIIEGTTHMELGFTTAGTWVYTKTEMRRNEIPQNIMSIFRASAYAAYSLDDTDHYNTPTGEYYLFELDAEPDDIKIRIYSDGRVERTNSDF